MAARAKPPVSDPFASLAAWLDAVPGRAADLARAVEMSESSVSRWRRRDAVPCRLAARVIERRVRIPRALWEPLRAARRAAA